MIQVCIRVKKIYLMCKENLDLNLSILFESFRDNYLKANSIKSHVMLTTENKLKINIKDSLISNEKLVKLVGVNLGNLKTVHAVFACYIFQT